MSYQYIISEQSDEGIVTVTINDPAAKNAVNWVMNKELVAECKRIESDPKARVMILTGSGTIFCSGGNIKRMVAQGKSLKPPDPTMREQMFPHEADMRAVIVSLHRMTKPVIAAVNGPAIGSGLGIASGCDIRIAATTARFGWVFLRRGIIPDDGSLAFVPQIIGYSRAFLWGVTGRTLDAAEALANGFVNEVVDPARLMERCRDLALEIIEHCPPVTVQLFKLSLTESLHCEPEDAVRITERAQLIARATEDHTEALKAFAEKRRPVWKGQ